MFEAKRQELQELLSFDEVLYQQCMKLFVDLMDFQYVSSKNWMGIPIVKLPEDIVVIQEFHYEYKPTAVIEVGVARGGSVALAVSLQRLNNVRPHVIGIDIKILEHTRQALADYQARDWLHLVECDSVSEQARSSITDFIAGHDRVFAILDGNHSHEHVMRELALMNEVLPVGSVVLVADGIIEYLPERNDRPWGTGNSPYTALNQFLEGNSSWIRLERFARRSLFSEFRDGWIVKVS